MAKIPRFIVNAIKRIFNILRLTISMKGGTGRTMADSLNHFKTLGFKPKTVIDIGVGYGTSELYKTFPNARHILIEPLVEFKQYLEKITQQYDGEYIIAAASDKLGKIIINVQINKLQSSSIFKEKDAMHSESIKGIPREVTSITLDNLKTKLNLIEPFLLKIDVQGAELKVLDGARKMLEETQLVILEVQLFQFQEGSPKFFDTITYMKNNGFVVYDFFGGSERPIDGALAWIDIAFVKETGQFRRHHFFMTPEQRARTA